VNSLIANASNRILVEVAVARIGLDAATDHLVINDVVESLRTALGIAPNANDTYLEEAARIEANDNRTYSEEAFAAFLVAANTRWYEVE